MSNTPRLFCLDTVLIDVVLKIAALPERAGDALAHEQLITTGGGFNAMSAAARHNLPVVYAGRLGAGPFATLASLSLENEGIATPVDRNETLDTGICVVLVEPDGERSFVTSPGAEATLRAIDVETLGVGDGDYVLVSGYNVMYPVLAELVIGWLSELPREVTVVFDPATRMTDIPAENVAAMLDIATWLVCNANEGSTLSGNDDVALSATMLASSRDSLNVLVRQGALGCAVALSRSDAVVVDGFATTVVDTTGAGDVHNGVFIAELASGHDALGAARRANAAAAMAISKFGPATCPPRKDVAAWIARSRR
ncbi:MAG TPA: PfkB family carbohydrate kinase [Acidimicrobiales bacterium]|nr:PfkB family carbohydrate kinase [Acidimicrobiales bacterium]